MWSNAAGMRASKVFAGGTRGHSLGVWVVLVAGVSLTPYLYLWLTMHNDHTPVEVRRAIFGGGGMFLTAIGILVGSIRVYVERKALITLGLTIITEGYSAGDLK